jgi:hypothetical protein
VYLLIMYMQVVEVSGANFAFTRQGSLVQSQYRPP